MEVNLSGMQQPQPMVTFKTPDNGDEKTYLILIVGTDEEGYEFKDWQFKEGRKEAYKYIKSMVEHIDLFESRIVVDSEKISDIKRVIEFMRYVVDSGLIDDPGFDIMDYVKGDYIEEEEKEEE